MFEPGYSHSSLTYFIEIWGEQRGDYFRSIYVTHSGHKSVFFQLKMSREKKKKFLPNKGDSRATHPFPSPGEFLDFLRIFHSPSCPTPGGAAQTSGRGNSPPSQTSRGMLINPCKSWHLGNVFVPGPSAPN